MAKENLSTAWSNFWANIQWLPSGLDLDPSDWLDNFENNLITNPIDGNDQTTANAEDLGTAVANAIPSSGEFYTFAVVAAVILILVLLVLGKLEAL
jgi:hypothetical protein